MHNILLEFGYVHAFDPFKGFGFIRRKKGKDVFFHYTSIPGDEHTITIGDNVSFEITKTPKGLKAKNVTRLT